MFKRTRRKIIAAIMSVLVLLWVGTLGVIYASSYFEMKSQNKQMLEVHAEMYTINQPINDFPSFRPRPDGDRDFNHKFNPESPRFKLSTFYSVAISYDGDIIEIRNEPSTVYTNDELTNLAQNIIQSGKTNGTQDNLVFYKTNKDGYTLVAFMDNTVINENAMTLFRYTLIFGSVALVVFFFLSMFLARKIVNPLEESYQKQKQFISDAGHELKTPVSVVSANAELLSREIGDNTWLQNIQYENERMGKLVGQLLELARTENVKPQMEYLDISRLVAGGVLPFESVAYESGVTLNSQITDNIIAFGNSTQLSQLVSILVDNAIQHSHNGKEVFVSLSQTRNEVVFSVINYGDPIPQEQMAKLFERFYRADEARNGEDKHYGLGLAIAKAIVESHHGKIEVSCYDGKVCFTARLTKT